MISLYGLETILSNIERGKGPVSLNGLTKSVKGILAASLAQRLDRPLVIVTDKAARAEELHETLNFFMPAGSGSPPLLYFPPWEILPYEEMSPHPEISGQRLATLMSLVSGVDTFIMVTTVEALARKIMPPEALKRSLLKIETGDSLDMELLSEHLISHGYRRVNIAEERGEFAIRGNIVDIFDGTGKRPYRIDFFGDTVESIRMFNPDNQRSVENVEGIELVPFREVFYEGVDPEALAQRYKEAAAEEGASEEKSGRIAELLRTGSFFNGMEKFLPYFFGGTCTVFDYLPGTAALAIDEPEETAKHMEYYLDLVEEEYGGAADFAAGDPDDLYMAQEELEARISDSALLHMGELAVSEGDDETLVISSRQATRYRGDVQSFFKELEKLRSHGYSVVLAAATPAGARRLEKTLKDNDLGAAKIENDQWAGLISHLCDPQPSLFEGNLFIVTGVVSEGFVIPGDKWALITEDEIFGKVRKIKRRSKKIHKAFSVGVSELSPGDLVAHKTHGIGKYIRAKEMVIADARDEYLEIEYAENQRLYVPIQSIDVIKKFTGGGRGTVPILDRMGGATWRKTKAKVKKSLLAMADKLLRIYASRKLGKGTEFSPDAQFHREFADTFEFEETEDQLAAITDVAADMENEKPMDRLVCGDVGYGKTEVAMRAAFKAIHDGRQVAMLVPTTLLAQQHYQTFTERFKAFPVTIEALSRFRTAKEQKAIVQAAAEGQVDIIIGTHRLLQKDVAFKNLGLVIIDEEQRFGVAHKEKLKGLRTSVDVMTLTATPIPRTLHSSMMGIRDLSVIETPPPDRLSVRTVIAKFSDKVVREALLRELDRGGQAFFVHNKVKSIHSLAKYLRKLVPEARVAVAHGQMPERELEKVMMEFMDRKYDVLVCTTIIESGLDIQPANTILINRADHFGLAQTYQLRGRVGRDRHRAYCYLLIPGQAGLTETAKERLKAIEELSDLGSGFKLAARDMEIRGAGNLLGAQQSGQIDAVGFDTYCEMLEETIAELKGEPPGEKFEVDMNLSFQGRIPPDYVADLNSRMELYNRLSSITALDQMADLEEEMRDRFGPPPEETEKLLAATKIKAMAKRLKIEKVDMIGARIFFYFNAKTNLSPARLALVDTKRFDFKFVSEFTVEYRLQGEGWRERLASMLDFLADLAGAPV